MKKKKKKIMEKIYIPRVGCDDDSDDFIEDENDVEDLPLRR